ncbi:hypothetical protein QMTAC487_11590 [Sphaerotilus sp. FB-3]|nr:hypothetical protein QMTAC487_11590 [Sphaerotilus sp. FB-3]
MQQSPAAGNKSCHGRLPTALRPSLQHTERYIAQKFSRADQSQTHGKAERVIQLALRERVRVLTADDSGKPGAASPPLGRRAV